MQNKKHRCAYNTDQSGIGFNQPTHNHLRLHGDRFLKKFRHSQE
jgi:hypothetical protein